MTLLSLKLLEAIVELLAGLISLQGDPISPSYSTDCCDPHKGLSIVKAEVGVFLKFSCFFYDPSDVGNLISGSSASSKSSLYI